MIIVRERSSFNWMEDSTNVVLSLRDSISVFRIWKTGSISFYQLEALDMLFSLRALGLWIMKRQEESMLVGRSWDFSTRHSYWSNKRISAYPCTCPKHLVQTHIAKFNMTFESDSYVNLAQRTEINRLLICACRQFSVEAHFWIRGHADTLISTSILFPRAHQTP